MNRVDQVASHLFCTRTVPDFLCYSTDRSILANGLTVPARVLYGLALTATRTLALAYRIATTHPLQTAKSLWEAVKSCATISFVLELCLTALSSTAGTMLARGIVLSQGLPIIFGVLALSGGFAMVGMLVIAKDGTQAQLKQRALEVSFGMLESLLLSFAVGYVISRQFKATNQTKIDEVIAKAGPLPKAEEIFLNQSGDVVFGFDGAEVAKTHPQMMPTLPETYEKLVPFSERAPTIGVLHWVSAEQWQVGLATWKKMRVPFYHKIGNTTTVGYRTQWMSHGYTLKEGARFGTFPLWPKGLRETIGTSLAIQRGLSSGQQRSSS
ncbi:MAG: hypothetical protein ACOYKZ_01930 [Chlamydiia bacterium]